MSFSFNICCFDDFCILPDFLLLFFSIFSVAAVHIYGSELLKKVHVSDIILRAKSI
jgi:hypothetical protein